MAAGTARFTVCMLVIINAFSLLLSIPMLVVGILLAKRHLVDCLSFLEWPILIIGIAMFVVSLIGLLGVAKWQPLLIWTYLVIMLLIILVLFCFTIFAFVVTEGGEGHNVPGANFKQYRLSDFSPWLQDRVRNANNWQKIKHCIRDSLVCESLTVDYPILSDLYQSKLSAIETGCCMPPYACGFKPVSPTDWISLTPPVGNGDCRRWNNNPNHLCYDCASCRAGVLHVVTKYWRKVAIVSVVVLLLLIILYGMAWVVFLNALRANLIRRVYGAGARTMES